MEPKGFIPILDDPKTLVEIDIRGRFLMMACDIEWTLFLFNEVAKVVGR